MDNYISVCLYNEKLFSIEKSCTIATYKNVNESFKHIITQKKPYTKSIWYMMPFIYNSKIGRINLLLLETN